MVNTTRSIACVLFLGASVCVAHAQTPSAEVDVTAGYSGEEIRAAATQLRVFGDGPSQIRYFAEMSWGGRWAGGDPVLGAGLIGVDPIGTDVFGAAYPYRQRLQFIEAYAERYFRRRSFLIGARAGQFRTPFGIYTRSDYGYSGFVRPPLIRYDGYYALSNNWLEQGATITAGHPQLFVEASLGRPHDVGTSQRRSGMDQSIRVQGYHGPFIVGVSHARSNPYLPTYFAVGRQAFTGVDVRFTSSQGVQIRSELIQGHSYEGVSTTGWYVDGMLHRPVMGPFTAVVRAESLDYTARAPFARAASRFTIGTRVRLPGRLTAQVNFMHQNGDMPRIYDSSVDFSVTYSLRYR
jgi:hypothetical protein